MSLLNYSFEKRNFLTNPLTDTERADMQKNLMDKGDTAEQANEKINIFVYDEKMRARKENILASHNEFINGQLTSFNERAGKAEAEKEQAQLEYNQAIENGENYKAQITHLRSEIAKSPEDSGLQKKLNSYMTLSSENETDTKILSWKLTDANKIASHRAQEAIIADAMLKQNSIFM